MSRRINAAPEGREQPNKKLWLTSQHRGRATVGLSTAAQRESPRAVRHNLTDPRTNLGLAMLYDQDKIGCDVLFTRASGNLLYTCQCAEGKREGGCAILLSTIRPPFSLPCFQRRPNGSISRLPDATPNLRAPKDDKTHTQPLELGA